MAARFLDLLQSHGSMGLAAREAGLSESAIRTRRKRDPMFDKSVRYYRAMGRGFCHKSLGLSGVQEADVPAIKAYVEKLGLDPNVAPASACRRAP